MRPFISHPPKEDIVLTCAEHPRPNIFKRIYNFFFIGDFNEDALEIIEIEIPDKYEMFLDEGYFHLWAVRPKGDKSFNSPRLFHFKTRSEAEQFKELIEKSL